MSMLSILCPVDFSDSSRAALRYATAIAGHCRAELTVMTVEDPLLAEMDVERGQLWPHQRACKELAAEVAQALGGQSGPIDIRYVLAVGKPAAEILRVGEECRADLIVMSSHGLTGVRKLFFGSTTERVLRETSVPVLVTKATDYGPLQASQMAPLINRVLVPVDFTSASMPQLLAAGVIATALNVPILLTHVVEPMSRPNWRGREQPSVDAERRANAEERLDALAQSVPAAGRVETLVAYGDPAEEIAKIARDRRTQLVVIGLRAATPCGPRIGSVTYRVICLAPSLVLSLPPVTTPARAETTAPLDEVTRPVGSGCQVRVARGSVSVHPTGVRSADALRTADHALTAAASSCGSPVRSTRCGTTMTGAPATLSSFSATLPIRKRRTAPHP